MSEVLENDHELNLMYQKKGSTMNRDYHWVLFIVLSFLTCTSNLQGTEKKPAKEQFASKNIDGPLPIKPYVKIIEEKFSFNSWIDEGFLRLKNQITYAEIYKLRSICLRDGGLFEITTQDGRTIEDIDSLIKKLETMGEEGNPYIQTFKKTFIPLVKDTRKKLDHFLTNNTRYKGLEEKSKPDEMIAHWFRYAYLYAHEPDKIGPLFTREFRKKIYANEYPTKDSEEDEFGSTYHFLEELLEMYYDAGIKNAKFQVYKEFGIKDCENHAAEYKLMSRAFEVMKSGFGFLIVQEDKQTRILLDERESVAIAIWKLEEGAWRFNGLVLPDTKKQ